MSKIRVDLSKKLNFGSAYVAVSRVKTLSGLVLSQFCTEDLGVDAYLRIKVVGKSQSGRETPIERGKIDSNRL